MFGVDFSELAVIFCVALVVIGPKRMPGLVKKIGRWVGKARVMARDFQQQLENEVNLEELNKLTDMQAKPAQSDSPLPPELTGALPAENTPTYPYASPYESPPVDDSYSHAHGAGDPPMPHEPEPAAEATAPAVADAAPATAEDTVPAQASFDLSTPDESHLPPEDTRRST